MTSERTAEDLYAKGFCAGMVILFVLMHVAFHPTYIQYFPEFLDFTWTHHIHGALMAAWMMVLIVQPYLIYNKKYKAHRLIGKLSYVIAPLVLISMFMITRVSYLKTVGNMPFEEVAAIQALNFVTPLNFILFYSLAIINKRDVYSHKRYMIATAFTISPAILSRLLYYIFGDIEHYAFFIAEYLGLGVIILLLANDLIKKANPVPYIVVAVALCINISTIHSRKTEEWQSVVRFVGDAFF